MGKCYPCAGPRRKYLCNRKRKATTRRCCKGGIRSKVTLCNRNWRRISVNPFVNFVRQFRKGKQRWPLAQLLCQARRIWSKMSAAARRCYVQQACRARKRGYRT